MATEQHTPLELVMLNTLKAAEDRLVSLYRGINPHGNYDDELTINGHISGNRFADGDDVVQQIREVRRAALSAPEKE